MRTALTVYLGSWVDRLRFRKLRTSAKRRGNWLDDTDEEEWVCSMYGRVRERMQMDGDVSFLP
jgi:hypothetical protein